MSKSEQKQSVNRDSDKFQLRLPDGMRDKVSDASKRNGRSMNAELVARLEQSFVGDPEAMLACIQTHIGLIQFLADCVEDVAEMVPKDSPSYERLEQMLKLSRAISVKMKK